MHLQRGRQPGFPIKNQRILISSPQFTLFIVWTILLSSCLYPGGNVPPTAYPSDYLPTVVALTGQSAYATAVARTSTFEIPISTNTFVPTAEEQTSTPAPTLTPTPEPGFGNYAQIRFLSPGPMSKIISPLKLQLLIVSGEREIVQIDLLGEDGRKLYSKLERVRRQSGGAYRTLEIPFEFRAVAELGWLQITTRDNQNRIQAINSLRILLQSSGVNEITPPGNIIYERVVLDAPNENEQAFGGILTVSGRISPINYQPVILELISSEGKVLATRVLTMDGIEPQYFKTTLPYKSPLSEDTVTPAPKIDLARLTIHQDDPILNIPIYIYTRLVELHP
jgi:hypothetical protein